MIHLIRKYAKACLVSLVVLAISLPMFAMAAVAPTVTVLPTFHEGGDLPNSVAIASDGTLYVGNFAGGAINQLDPTGKFMRTVNKAKIYSNAIAFSQDGTLLVVTNNSVVRMALDGTVLGTLQATMNNPKSVAVDDLGYIYVVDVTGGQVLVFGSDYQYRSRFGSKGSALGQLLNPSHITFDKVNRQLIVADTLNNRVQIFDTNGNPVKAFGTVAAAMGRPILPMEFHSPQAVAIEYTKSAPYQLNRYYVLDTMQNMIQVIDPATFAPLLFPGKTNNFIGGTTTYTNGSMIAPSSLVYDQVNGRLLATNDLGITVYGIDGGGNPADTTPPLVAIDAVPATVFAPSIALTGTVEAGATVIVSSAAAIPVQMTSPTAWKAVVSPLAAGLNTISVTAKDAAGNVAPSQSVNVSYVLPAPAVTLAAVPGVTNTASLVVAGTVDAGSSVKVKNSTTQVEGDAVVSGTAWTYAVTLVEGVNALSVSASAANTQTAVKEAAVILDATPPKLTVSALSSGSVTSVQDQNIAGTIVDTAQVSVLVNSIPVDLIDGAFSTAVTLKEGQNQIVVLASDAAGNTVQDVRDVTFDSTKPVITIADSTLPDNTTTTAPLYAIAGSVSEPVQQVTVAGAPVVLDASNGWASKVNLVAGENTVEVVATDFAGNTSSVKRTVTYASEKIDLAIVVPAQDTVTHAKTAVFAGTLSANASTLSYSVNNGRTVPVRIVKGKYIFSVDFKNEGTYSVAITAKDSAGLSTTVVRTIIFEKKARHSRSR